MAFKPFEKGPKDKEFKGKGKEGSKREEKFDAKQAKRPMPFAKGGMAKGKRGC
jgi:hypothetical protein